VTYGALGGRGGRDTKATAASDAAFASADIAILRTPVGRRARTPSLTGGSRPPDANASITFTF
jgi:hypothetical protein